MARSRWAVALVAFVVAACGGEDAAVEGNRPPSEPRAATSPPGPSLPRVVFLGDSLTAGLGVEEEQAFPHLVEGLLAESGHRIETVNAGVSGDTSAGGASRIDWLLRQSPDIVVVALGANDGLRAVPVGETESNLRHIVTRCLESGSEVLLAGMKVPPNYGDLYASSFSEVFPRVAEDLGVALVPFLLQGVGGEEELNQADGIHPNAAGHAIIARLVAPYLEETLERLERGRNALERSEP